MKFTLRKLSLLAGSLCFTLFCLSILRFHAPIDGEQLQHPPNLSHDSEVGDSNTPVSLSSPISGARSDTHSSEVVKKPRKNKKKKKVHESIQEFKNILCNVNDEYQIDCLKRTSNDSVFVPFSFIKKYFDINGKLGQSSQGAEYLDWHHSYSRIFYPDEPYRYSGKYLWFENYNVELRDRVLCVSASEGVPISTQWYAPGHFYPTQIAQYGLSHFNKNLTEDAPKKFVLIQDGQKSKNVEIVSSINNRNSARNSGSFTAQNHTSVEIADSEQNALIGYLVVDLRLRTNMSHLNVTFQLTDVESKQQYSLLYSTLVASPLIFMKPHSKANQTIPVYGLSSTEFTATKSQSVQLTRDLMVDLSKGRLITPKKRSSFVVNRIVFDGDCSIESIVLQTSAHAIFAQTAGDWFVRHQSSSGGWDITVKRKLQNNKSGVLILEKGWHSAMAQGQAISLLVRLYETTRQQKYLEAAKKALTIFKLESIQNGVRAHLFGKFVWYEEYPTVPSIFVLNGFIYSLFGLYDLSRTCNDSACKLASELFDDGIRSLESVLLLYDSGSGSFYDLRHLALGGPPNVARWDYHSTHINQLLQLNTIVQRDLFSNTAERWSQYMKGHRAPHN